LHFYYDGTSTTSVEESFAFLLGTHFPESEVIPEGETGQEEEVTHTSSASSRRLSDKIVTKSKLKWAINSFKPYKSPSLDGIYPVLLQKGYQILELYLVKILKACIALGYTPIAWISLMSFLLKTMEKLVDRYIRDEVLALKPLHKFQYAYQPGKSTETTLHHLVTKI
jgi:hypothetical protein